MFFHIKRLFSKNKSTTLDESRRDYHSALVDELKRTVGNDITIELDNRSNIIYIDDDNNIEPMWVFAGVGSQRKVEVTLMIERDGGYRVAVVIVLPEHLLKSYLNYQMHLNQINL